MRGFKAIRNPSTQPQPQSEIPVFLFCLGDKLEDLGLNSWQLRTLFELKK